MSKYTHIVMVQAEPDADQSWVGVESNQDPADIINTLLEDDIALDAIRLFEVKEKSLSAAKVKIL